jgi:hypothetical protein
MTKCSKIGLAGDFSGESKYILLFSFAKQEAFTVLEFDISSVEI